MDYKRLIKSQSVRIKILHLLDFVPDKWMIRLQYWIKTGRLVHLSSPQRYTEKLQWYKLYHRDPQMKRCADKYEVRSYVKERGLGDILNDLYGVYDTPDQICFDQLPKSFVIKDTMGGGGNSVILVPDKGLLNEQEIKDTLWSWVNTPVTAKNPGREWVYEGVKHRIIIERLLTGDSTGDLPDYKFFCFNGKVEYLYLMKNYTQHHELGVLGFLTPDFRLLPAHRKDFAPMTEQPSPPPQFQRMVQIAETLAEGFPHVRVDLYNLEGEILFGEMTFFNASGYNEFEPDAFDFEMGSKWILPPPQKPKNRFK